VAKVYQETAENIQFLANELQKGELVAIPSETVYGLAANAFDETACRKIFEIKDRPFNDPLIVHLDCLNTLDKVAERSEAVDRLANAFWPGPLTLILPKKKAIPSLVTAGLESVAVRIPNHPVFQKLLKDCQLPLAAPSANPFGYISPTTSAHVQENLGNKINYILEGGACQIGIESTIVDLRDPSSPAILRPGGLSEEAISSVLDLPLQKSALSIEEKSAAIAPGLCRKHYSPKTQLTLRSTPFTDSDLRNLRSEEAALCFKKPDSHLDSLPENVFWLSESGNDEEAGRNLFSKLRQIDSGPWQSIKAELAPDTGIGNALNDRLRRAAAKG
jgi:L-threonylcarbamoyladenylate synthase